ncbi:MAG: L,D-transpeptidase family protein [Lachnospiraceae bacterium]|nr:L,D-transpeptidase family protein [Lachnospiraceae bacterium]
MSTKKLSKKKQALVIAGFVLLALTTVYLGIAVYFSSHFFFQTTINGVDASGKSVQSVEKMIAAEIDQYQISIEPREGEAETIEGMAVGLKPVFDGTLEIELRKQNQFIWPVAFFQDSVMELETMVDYDKEKLRKEAKKLEMMDKAQMRKAENAMVSKYSKKEGYTIIPEEEGTVVDEEKFFEVLEDSVTNLKGSISMAEEGCYVKPEFTQDSKEIVKLAETMNKYAGTAITYDFGDKQEVLDGKTIHKWISVNEEEHKAQISQEKVAEYVAYLADTYNTAGKSKSLKSSYGTDITVSGGDYGWKIDQEKETEALAKNIKKGEKITKEPEYSQTANSRAGNDYGDTYVEVNLTAQHLYYYKNGSLVLETDFVSGNDAKGWSTPVGAYGLYYKQLDKTLRGEGYATPVDFWMPFNGGVGFHDATWRRDFGGNYYKRNGSHGCVNMPHSAAKTLYDNIEAGCAVLVYQLSGTESPKAKAQDAAAAVVQLIGSLGDVSLESKGAVEHARNQYNALDGTAKGYVSNYGQLEAAEARIGQLEAEAAADQQAQAEAQPVIDAINQLAGQEITVGMKDTINGIRNMYNGLSEAARAKVTNYNILTDAEQKVAELEKKEKEDKEKEDERQEEGE